MNQKRRNQLSEIQSSLYDLREKLEDLKIEEENYRDNIPENMMESEKYSKADSAVEAMEEALESLDSSLESVGAASM